VGRAPVHTQDRKGTEENRRRDDERPVSLRT
jgi:hypothetical protein